MLSIGDEADRAAAEHCYPFKLPELRFYDLNPQVLNII